MTTYTWSGYTFDGNPFAGVATSFSASTADIVFDDSTTTFSYMAGGTVPYGEEQEIFVNEDSYDARIDGVQAIDVTSTNVSETIQQIFWLSGTFNTTYVYAIYDIDNDQSYVYWIGGDPLPVFTSVADVNSLFDESGETITDPSTGTGFGPGDDIPLAGNAAFTSTEADSIGGFPWAESIDGGMSDDTINGGGGNDTLLGGIGDDLISGGLGTDKLYDGAGQDTVLGDEGGDTFYLDAASVNEIDSLDGGVGRDRVVDDLSGLTPQSFVVDVDLDAGLRDQNGVADILTNIEEYELIGDFDAIIDGTQLVNTLIGGDGSATIRALGGNDYVQGGAAADELRGGTGGDTVIGGGGNDSVFGGAGADSLEGGDGNDSINPGFGNDVALGGDGNDTINTGDGSDTIDGGIGADSILGGDSFDFIDGGSGNDFIDGQRANDSIDGGIGNDTLLGFIGTDTIVGGDGADSINGGAGNDSLNGDAGADTILGGDGGDTINGGTANDELRGGLGADEVNGDSGADTLFGGDGSDTLDGGDAADQLFGGNGADELTGGAGADTMEGGGGADTFRYLDGTGNDTVVDFDITLDRLALDDALWSGTLTQAQVVSTFADDTSGSTIFTFSGSETLTLNGIDDKNDLIGLIDFI